jgi:hypothetical protein
MGERISPPQSVKRSRYSRFLAFRRSEEQAKKETPRKLFFGELEKRHQSCGLSRKMNMCWTCPGTADRVAARNPVVRDGPLPWEEDQARMDEPPPGTPKGFTSPPTFGASKIAVAVTPAEIIITIGQSRQLIDQATGQTAGQAATEWFASYSFSATAAQDLHMALGEALRRYEARFGKVPQDPNMRVASTQGGRSGGTQGDPAR